MRSCRRRRASVSGMTGSTSGKCAVPEESWAEQPVKDYYLIYYSFMRPSSKDYYFDDTTEFQVKVIDTWNMTVEDRGVMKGKIHIELPGRQYMAVQMKKV